MSHCFFNLHFPYDVLFDVRISSLMRCLLRSLTHFLIRLFIFLLLSLKCSLRILYNSPLSGVSFANIFSHSVACLFILLTLSFPEQMFFNFPAYQFFRLWIVPLVASPNPRSSRISPVLPSRNFIVLHFIFRSMIHFESIFVKDEGLCLDSICAAPFVKRLSLFHCIAFTPLSEIN